MRDTPRVDAERGWVYFTAGGREEGRDPYFRHLYRCTLDGADLTLLTPEDADHTVTFSPSGAYFVDTYSRVDLPPVSVLRRADGTLIDTLEEADISALTEMGWRAPERFTVKARDGVTDLYGCIFRPTNFDPSRTYPVLDSIYPGPQTIHTPKAFGGGDTGGRNFWQDQALAELGFIVVTIDGMGTPYRSKAFVDVAYGAHFGEAGGLEDHIVGLRQLAARDPSLDLSRVGIYGHSGGGFASAHALLSFPDFYKVAVSSAGNHNQMGYLAGWGERYIGMPEGDNYAGQVNATLAGNLRGKLLLVHGEMDDNVHPSLTMQLADALIAANKDFDLLIIPFTNHAFFDLRWGLEAADRFVSLSHPYFVRKRWDYFVTHLLGATPPPGYAIAPMVSARNGSAGFEPGPLAQAEACATRRTVPMHRKPAYPPMRCARSSPQSSPPAGWTTRDAIAARGLARRRRPHRRPLARRAARAGVRRQADDGGVDPHGRPHVVADSGACLVVDGGNSMGQIGAHFAMQRGDRAGGDDGHRGGGDPGQQPLRRAGLLRPCRRSSAT